MEQARVAKSGISRVALSALLTVLLCFGVLVPNTAAFAQGTPNGNDTRVDFAIQTKDVTGDVYIDASNLSPANVIAEKQTNKVMNFKLSVSDYSEPTDTGKRSRSQFLRIRRSLWGLTLLLRIM